MTQIAIQKQIATIDKATRQALKTRESAAQFLVDAGIYTEEELKLKPKPKTKKA